MAIKRILTNEDLDTFLKHEVCRNFLEFLDKLSLSVTGKRKSDVSTIVPTIVENIIALLENCEKRISLYCPNSRDSRFGHPEFRNYFDDVVLNFPRWLQEIIPQEYYKHIPELSAYFCSSFGNRQRIDYGTGHEMHFLVFLFCLDRLNILEQSMYDKVVLVIFWRYIDWMRKLQITYWLEPAGSHGVWGLDDYHFLPFFFGSAQLVGHKYIRPKSIHNLDIITEFSAEYLYLKCIKFVNEVKTESLAWHSPMLNDISGVKSWQKINEGMRKMYVGEVLGKLPIMQHLLFGELFGNIKIHYFDSIMDEVDDSGQNEFIPPSGHSLDADANVHMAGCSQAIELSEQTKEVIVKYVLNSRGEKIPIYGRIRAGSDRESDVIMDTYALGQSHPVCCGIRIPSALSVAKENNKILPFD